MKDLKESISGSYSQQLKDLQGMLDSKQKELLEQCKSVAEQKHARADLNERLSASMQSCAEANAIVNRYDFQTFVVLFHYHISQEATVYNLEPLMIYQQNSDTRKT